MWLFSSKTTERLFNFINVVYNCYKSSASFKLRFHLYLFKILYWYKMGKNYENSSVHYVQHFTQ